MLWLWFLLALGLERAQLLIGSFNYGQAYNGLGAIEGVLHRNGAAPQVYRVTAAWWVRAWERVGVKRLTAYEWFKVLAITYALWACERTLGVERTLLLAVLLLFTFYFDYWDWCFELGGLALALTGQWEWTLVGIVLFALSRETAPLAALLYGIVTGDWLGAVGLGAVAVGIMGGIRLWQGKHELYCERVMVRRNWNLLKNIRSVTPFISSNVFTTLLVSGLMLYALAVQPSGWQVGALLLGMGWTLSVAEETRVFTGCLLWIALVLPL